MGVHEVKAHLWQTRGPSALIAFHGKMDALHDSFVCMLAGPVHLGVVSGGEFEVNACELVECLPKVGHEEFVVVQYDFQRQTIFTVPVLEK